MDWLQDIRLRYKSAIHDALQSRIITNSTHNLNNIIKGLLNKLNVNNINNLNISFDDIKTGASKLFTSNSLDKNIKTASSPNKTPYFDVTNSNRTQEQRLSEYVNGSSALDKLSLNSKEKDNLCNHYTLATTCGLLFDSYRLSKTDKDAIACNIEDLAVQCPEGMNLPSRNNQQSPIKSVLNWIDNEKSITSRDAKLAINILKYENSINQKVTDHTNNLNVINSNISHIIRKLFTNYYIDNDWYQILNRDERIKIALGIDSDTSNLIDIAFKRYQKFNDVAILDIIIENIDKLHISEKNISDICDHIQDEKKYDNAEVRLFINMVTHAYGDHTELSDDSVSKICRLLFRIHKSSKTDEVLRYQSTKALENLVVQYPKIINSQSEDDDLPFIHLMIRSAKHAIPKKMIQNNHIFDIKKCDTDEVKFFIKMIQNASSEKDIFLSSEGYKIIKLLFNIYKLPKISTRIKDESVTILQKLISQHPELINMTPESKKHSLSELVINSIQKSKPIDTLDAKLATSIIKHDTDSNTHIKRTILELLNRNYKYADREEIMKEAVDAASANDLNMQGIDGNTFAHFCIKQYQQSDNCCAYSRGLIQYMLKSNKINVTAQNNKGETILHLLDLGNYDDQILALDILKNTQQSGNDLYLIADRNGNQFIKNIIQSLLNSNDCLDEICNLALKSCPDAFLSCLADSCTKSNLQKFQGVVDMLLKHHNSGEVIKSYCIKFIDHLKEQNKLDVAYAVEHNSLFQDLIQNSHSVGTRSVNNEYYSNEYELPPEFIAPSAPEECDIQSNIYPPLGFVMPFIEVY